MCRCSWCVVVCRALSFVVCCLLTLESCLVSKLIRLVVCVSSIVGCCLPLFVMLIVYVCCCCVLFDVACCS